MPTLSNQQIKDFVNGLISQYGSIERAAPYIFQAGIQYGVSPSQLDAAMGWAEGTSLRYSNANPQQVNPQSSQAAVGQPTSTGTTLASLQAAYAQPSGNWMGEDSNQWVGTDANYRAALDASTGWHPGAEGYLPKGDPSQIPSFERWLQTSGVQVGPDGIIKGSADNTPMDVYTQQFFNTRLGAGSKGLAGMLKMGPAIAAAIMSSGTLGPGLGLGAAGSGAVGGAVAGGGMGAMNTGNIGGVLKGAGTGAIGGAIGGGISDYLGTQFGAPTGLDTGAGGLTSQAAYQQTLYQMAFDAGLQGAEADTFVAGYMGSGTSSELLSSPQNYFPGEQPTGFGNSPLNPDYSLSSNPYGDLGVDPNYTSPGGGYTNPAPWYDPYIGGGGTTMTNNLTLKEAASVAKDVVTTGSAAKSIHDWVLGPNGEVLDGNGNPVSAEDLKNAESDPFTQFLKSFMPSKPDGTTNWASILGTIGATGLGMYSSNQMANTLQKLSDQNRADRAPYLAASQGYLADPASYGAGPGLAAAKNFGGLVGAKMGNPAQSGLALQLGTDAGLKDWREAVTGFGNMGLSGADTRANLGMAQAGAQGDVYSNLAGGVSNLLNPPSSLEELLRGLSKYKKAGVFG